MAFLKRTETSPAVHAGAQVARLYDEHARMVLGLCRVLLRDPHDAEDAAQQTFLSAHRSLAGGVEPRDPAAWLAAIARNECRARVRQRMATPTTMELPDELPGLIGADDVAALNDEMRDLRNALAALPERQRQALVLREFFGLRQDELAAALDVAEPSVESLLWRARKTLEKNRVAPDFGLAILVVPGTLREQLARAIPGFAEGANVASGGITFGVAAKAAAMVVAGVAAATGALRGDDGPTQPDASPPVATQTRTQTETRTTVQVVQQPTRTVVVVQTTDDDEGGRGRGRGRGGGDNSGSGSSGSDD